VVIDRVAPVVRLNGLPSVEVEVFSLFNDPGVTITENYWPVNTVLVQTRGTVNTNRIGTYVRWYIATDPSGNSDSVSRTIVVVDRTAPTITILGDNPFNLPRWREFVDPGVSVSDNYNTEAEILPSLLTTTTLPLNSNGKPFGDAPGLFAVDYRVTDLSGNTSATVTRLINVLEANSIAEVLNISTVMSVFPNPATDVLNVRLVKPTTDNLSIKLLDVQGRTVLVKEINNQITQVQTIHVGNLSKGIYLMQLTSGDKVYVHKVQIN
jgi:hypothetical protein